PTPTRSHPFLHSPSHSTHPHSFPTRRSSDLHRVSHVGPHDRSLVSKAEMFFLMNENPANATSNQLSIRRLKSHFQNQALSRSFVCQAICLLLDSQIVLTIFHLHLFSSLYQHPFVIYWLVESIGSKLLQHVAFLFQSTELNHALIQNKYQASVLHTINSGTIVFGSVYEMLMKYHSADI